MRAFRQLLPALILAVPALFAAPAGADKLTLGSDLTADATVIESHGADTTFWPISIAGDSPVMPEDGQILSVKIKGTVLKEKGAANPATLIHFQSLIPQGDNGDLQVWLTSQGFDMPVDQPNTINTFEPENLCVKKGGTVAFNDLGGFKYGGSLGGPLDDGHYHNGAPYQVFGAVRDSVTARYSADSGTKNGATFSPHTPNQAEGAPVGTTMQGEELLMQYVVGTGQDRSEPCGGPRRHPDGTLVDVTPPTQKMHVVTPQRPYVVSSGAFQTGVFCSGPADCAGTATVLKGKKTLVTAPFNVKASSTGLIPMKLKRKDYKKLVKARGKKLRIKYVLTTSFGTFSANLTIRH